MISIDTILNRLDLVVYIIVFAIMYIVLIFLWKKISQLESTFAKLETTFATQLLYKSKEPNIEKDIFEKDIFVELFNNDNNSSKINIVEDDIALSTENILEDENKQEELSKSKLSKLTLEQLKEHCNGASLSIDGTKQDLLNRILNSKKIS